MAVPAPASVRNRLLAALSPADFSLLEPQLEPVPLPVRTCLAEPNRLIENVYFLEQGIASVVASTPQGRRIEVGIIGREGLTVIEQRLVRWLLMCHDRVDGDELATTHEFLSLMLGVRRPGVTVALQAFEEHGLISTKRGQVTVLDRAGLEEAVAGDSYGLCEAEYERLVGLPLCPKLSQL